MALANAALKPRQPACGARNPDVGVLPVADQSKPEAAAQEIACRAVAAEAQANRVGEARQQGSARALHMAPAGDAAHRVAVARIETSHKPVVAAENMAQGLPLHLPLAPVYI